MRAEETLFQRFGKEFPEGTTLFREGDPGKEMFVLQSGKVMISKFVRGAEKVLATLGPGEFFGEMAIISNRPRNANAVVAETARLLVIDSKTFEAMIRGNGEIAVRMIKKLSERLTEADAQIESLMLTDPTTRVVQQLLLLSQAAGAHSDGPIEIEFSLKDEPAKIGVGEPAIRLMLNKLERAGLIEREGARLTIYSRARLREFLQYLEMKWKFGDL
jgi:CRP/FNR family cyclic AMP-dependent transcriptional regulator